MTYTAEVQAQYRDTNIDELVKGIAEIKEKFLKNALVSLQNDNLSLSTAKENGLDLWGQLLRFYRHIPLDSDPANDVNYFNFNAKNFRRLQFFNPNKPNYGRMTDDIFRRFLLLRYQSMFVHCTIPNLNAFMSNFFNEFDSISIRDTYDMSFVVYAFSSQQGMPDYLKWILSNYDLLPRPAGVGSGFIDAIPMLQFGFAYEGVGHEEEYYKEIGNFKNSNFLQGEL